MISNTQAGSMNSGLRRTIQGKVELYNGSTHLTTILPDGKEVGLQEIAVARTGEKGKFFGFGVSQKATVKILDKYKALSLTKGEILRTDFASNEEAYVRVCPSFYIKEVARDEKTNVITATAYDALDSATAHVWSELGMEAPYTLKDVVERITSLLGLVGYVTLPSGFNLNYEKEANFGGDENIRTVLNALAEVTQTIYYIDRSDKLVFKRLSQTSNPDFTIYKKDYFELTTALPVTITKIMHTTELGDNADGGTDTGTIQYIRDNPFWNTRTDLAVLISESVARISGLTIVPFTCKWRGNFLTEIGDKCTIETNEQYVSTFVLDDSLTYTGGLSQTCSWEYNPDSENTTASNPVTISEKFNQTFAKVDKIEKNITLYVGDIVNEVLPAEIEKALENIDLSEIEQEIEGLKATTSEQTENISQLTLTSQAINNEVSTLKTTVTTITNDLDEVVATQETIQTDIGNLQVKSNQITASVTGVEQKITTLENDIGDASDQANGRIDKVEQSVALKLDKEAVEITVDRRIEEGVDKVTTASKKYTFDDEGLNISAADSSINTTVTENGMRIFENTKEVLVADNAGVKAADLHAYTFLIIGENSRMEDRGNRTACFWIGKAGG